MAQLEQAPVRPSAAPPQVDPVRRGRGVRWGLAAVWIAFAVLIQMLRSNSTPLWDAMWAEDGRFFYLGARTDGLFGSLFKPLAGYLQVPARFLGWIAALFPTSDAILVMSVSAALVAALLSVYVFAATESVVPRVWQRVFIAALIPLHPAAAFEVVAAVNNVHWYLMFAAFWAALSRTESGRRIALDVFVVAVAALGDPLTGLLLPLVLVRAWRGSRSARATAVALTVSLMLQYVLAVREFGSNRPVSRSPEELPGLYGLRVAGSFLIGDHALPGWWDQHGLAFAYGALLVVAVGFALAVGVNAPPERRLLLILLAASAVIFVAPFAVRGGTHSLLRHPMTLNGSRYTIIPLWLLYSALAVALTRALPSRSAGTGSTGGETREGAGQATAWAAVAARVALPALAVLMILTQFATNFAGGPRSSGTSWRQGVREAKAVCLARNGVPAPPSELPSWGRPRLAGPDTVAIPVSPWGTRNFWAVRLPCDKL